MRTSYQAALGLLCSVCSGCCRGFVGLRQLWGVDDAKQRSTMTLRAAPYGGSTVARVLLLLRLVVSASPVNTGPAAQREKDVASHG